MRVARAFIFLPILAAVGCRQDPALPRRTLLLAEAKPVTIAVETRPAVPIPAAGLSIALPRAPEGSSVTYAVGVRPPPPKGMKKLVVAHESMTSSPRPAPPATPSSRPRLGAQVKGRYDIRVDVEAGGAGKAHAITPGPAAWTEGRLELPPGTTSLRISVAVATLADGEIPFLAEPVLVTQEADTRRSAILVSVDSLRADHLGCYGYDRPVSPWLDKLSRGAELHAEARTTSCWTLPGHVGMLASRYGSEVGATDPMSSPERGPKAIAEVLRDAGYLTFARVNHLLVSERFGFDRGFGIFRKLQGGTAETSVAEALAFLDAHRGEPAFLFLHLFDVHYDYAPPPPWNALTEEHYGGALTGHMRDLLPYFKGRRLSAEDRAHVVALYDGEIGLTDREIGRLGLGLRRRGIEGSTLLGVTSDHGEEFQEHGSLGHGLTLYEEMLRVPLLVRDGGPSAIHAGPASLLDVPPTFAAALGMTAPPDWRGKPLGRGSDPTRMLLAENRLFAQDITAALKGPRKAVLDHRQAEPIVTWLDLDADAAESLPATAPGDEALVLAARFVRDATRAGTHRFDPADRDGATGRDPQSGCWHAWLGEQGGGGTATVPSGVQAALARIAKGGKAEVLRVVPAGAGGEHSPEELETLKQLGYVP